MLTYQESPNAEHFTKEKLNCSLCRKQFKSIIQSLDGNFFCFLCFIKNFASLFSEKADTLTVRLITDVFFETRKEMKVKERNKLTLKLRFEILKRDNFSCVCCGVTAKDSVLEIDHILPVSKGGKTISKNLNTLCFSCNRGKGANIF